MSDGFGFGGVPEKDPCDHAYLAGACGLDCRVRPGNDAVRGAGVPALQVGEGFGGNPLTLAPAGGEGQGEGGLG